jgi:hypothetical protein
MRCSDSNPPTNLVPEWVDETTLIGAIDRSGYPLQGVVAEKLIAARFDVTEEWGFLDKDTDEHRSLDLLAFTRLAEDKDPVVPRLALLIECKRSIHPYVFFKRVSDPYTARFPVITAAVADIEEERQGVGSRSYPSAPAQMILNLDSLPFITEPPRCASFSQAVLNGAKVNLSGEEPYKNIILPLVKSLQFRVQLDRPFIRSDRPVPTLVLCICVLDAPMLLVEAPSKAGDPVMTPWIRVLRLEAKQGEKQTSHEFFGIDFIHIDALDWLITENLMPFAREFARRALSLHQVWKTGGIVKTMDNIQWDTIRPKKR